MGGRGGRSGSRASARGEVPSYLAAVADYRVRSGQIPGSQEYRGYDIDARTYPGMYSVQYDGDDVMFRTEGEARDFIDSLAPRRRSAGATASGASFEERYARARMTGRYGDFTDRELLGMHSRTSQRGNLPNLTRQGIEDELISRGYRATRDGWRREGN